MLTLLIIHHFLKAVTNATQNKYYLCYYKLYLYFFVQSPKISFPFNFGLSWAKSLEHYDDEEIEAMFHFVIKHNQGWDKDDELMAIGDYGAVINSTLSD